MHSFARRLQSWRPDCAMQPPSFILLMLARRVHPFHWTPAPPPCNTSAGFTSSACTPSTCRSLVRRYPTRHAACMIHPVQTSWLRTFAFLHVLVPRPSLAQLLAGFRLELVQSSPAATCAHEHTLLLPNLALNKVQFA
jgi:hypothetical protein